MADHQGMDILTTQMTVESHERVDIQEKVAIVVRVAMQMTVEVMQGAIQERAIAEIVSKW